MMIFFALLVFLVMGLVGVLTKAAIPYVFDEPLSLMLERAVLIFDVAAMLGLIIIPLFFRDSFPSSWSAAGLRLVAMAFMAQLIFAAVVLVVAGIRGIMRHIGDTVPFDRRLRHTLSYAPLYPLAALAGGAYGGLYESDATEEREFGIPVKNLPENLRGYRIAQISDVHIGLFFSLDKLQKLLSRVAKGKPDALVITGDIFDDVSQNPQAIKTVDSFAKDFPNGIWYCHGNHEHHRGIEAISELLQGTAIHVLVNRAEIVVPGERPLVFAGVDYPMERGDKEFLAQKNAFTAEAWREIPQEAVVVLLAHHPEFIDNGAEKKAVLTLTGHTHGCQLGIFGIPLIPMFKYNRGMFIQGDSHGYVHSGNGSWFPYRLGCPPEIAYFTLRRG